MVPFALNNSCPVFPVRRHFGEDIAHDLRTGHKTMLFAFKDSNLAFAHQLAEPTDIIRWHSRILAAVVDDNRTVDVFVAETNGSLCFQTDHEIGGWVGVCGCAVPDGEREAFVKDLLAFAFGFGEGFSHLSFGVVERVGGAGEGKSERACFGSDLIHQHH